QKHRVQPLVMLQATNDHELVRDFRRIPADSWVYANPRYSTTLTPDIVAAHNVAGVKLSKITPEHLRIMRNANPLATILHGSSRNIQVSLDAGADLVATPPLAASPVSMPAPQRTAVQHA